MSKIEVNTVDVQCGSTLTLGSSGKTVKIATGASTCGMGRTGTVNWCTTAKTSPLTVESGKGYFINTTSGSITVTLPSSPSAGDIVAFKDYANTWDTSPVSVGRNGSKINGRCNDATLKTESQSVTLIYVDGTKGWQDIHDSTSDVTGESFTAASGGNATVTCGNYKTHIFTSSGTFTVSAVGNPDSTLEYLVVAGGGAGGEVSYGGGGGAGGFRLFTTAPGSNSPLNAPAGITAVAQAYPITVGAGGAVADKDTTNPGASSIFSSITSAGGGTGKVEACKCSPAMDGGSGAGGNADGPSEYSGDGNTPPVSPPQGNDGGTGRNAPFTFGGGGGGAGAVGFPGTPGPTAGHGGCGSYIANPFVGPTAPSYGTTGPVTPTRYFAGGGGGGSNANTPYPGTPAPGTNGGGNGGVPGYPGQSGQVSGGQAGTSATSNTGSGGGGSGYGPAPVNAAGAGGSGIVMIRYKFQ